MLIVFYFDFAMHTLDVAFDKAGLCGPDVSGLR